MSLSHTASSAGSSDCPLVSSRTRSFARDALGTGCMRAAMGAMMIRGVSLAPSSRITLRRCVNRSALTLDSPGASSSAGNTIGASGSTALISASRSSASSRCAHTRMIVRLVRARRAADTIALDDPTDPVATTRDPDSSALATARNWVCFWMTSIGIRVVAPGARTRVHRRMNFRRARVVGLREYRSSRSDSGFRDSEVPGPRARSDPRWSSARSP